MSFKFSSIKLGNRHIMHHNQLRLIMRRFSVQTENPSVAHFCAGKFDKRTFRPTKITMA